MFTNRQMSSVSQKRVSPAHLGFILFFWLQSGKPQGHLPPEEFASSRSHRVGTWGASCVDREVLELSLMCQGRYQTRWSLRSSPNASPIRMPPGELTLYIYGLWLNRRGSEGGNHSREMARHCVLLCGKSLSSQKEKIHSLYWPCSIQIPLQSDLNNGRILSNMCVLLQL